MALDSINHAYAVEVVKMLADHPGETLLDAGKHYCDYLSTLASSIAVSELCTRVKTEFANRVTRGEISSGYNNLFKQSLKRFTTRFGDRRIKHLADGLEIKAWLATEPLAIRTRNRHLNYIHYMFSLARDWNLLDALPFERIKPFYDPNAKARQVQILSPEQVTTFLNAVDPDLIPFYALCAFTGLRKAEVSRLDWSEVKLDRNIIDLPFAKSKNHRRKLIEIPENLKTWLAPFARPEGLVKSQNFLGKAFRTAHRKAGISPWPQNGLRHSFCSYAVALKGFEWTATQADHSLAILRRHYWEVVDKETAERYWQINPSLADSLPIEPTEVTPTRVKKKMVPLGLAKIRRAFGKAGKAEASPEEQMAFLNQLHELNIPVLNRSSGRIARVLKGELSIEALTA